MKSITFTEKELQIADREYCSRSLKNFVQRTWSIVEPSAELKWGWATDAICEHLEAVTRGDIIRLLINVPPGSAKSLLLNVFWPAWEWGALGRSDLRYICTAYKLDLAKRDTNRFSRVVGSNWYKDLWPVRLEKDNEQKIHNTHTGFYESMAFNSLTGSRGDRVNIDDPHSVRQGDSEEVIETTVRGFREAIPSRTNNDDSSIVIIMQRIGVDDVSAAAMEIGYEHLCIPMRYEKARHCTTSIGWTDPRSVEGELFFPERFSQARVLKDEQIMGPYAVAGQFQQNPVPRGGTMFKEEWFEGKIVTGVPPLTSVAMGWDFAGTQDGGDGTASAVVGMDAEMRVYILNVTWDQLDSAYIYDHIYGIVSLYNNIYPDMIVSFPQDPGQAGKWQAKEIGRKMQGMAFLFSPETGSKELRATPFASQCSIGNVYLLEGHWNKSCLDELIMFPKGKVKDRTDAISRAYAQAANMCGYNIETMIG